MIKKTTLFLSTFFILFLSTSKLSQAQVTIEAGADLEILLQQLLGSGIAIDLSSVEVTCLRPSYGRYTNEYTELPLDSGIVLTTGRVANIGALPGVLSNENMGTAGDADLTDISGNATNDACILTFDVTPFGNEIFFNYTFASEEYRNGGVDGADDFTNCPNPPAAFNDVFAFFITGPDPDGGDYNNLNIATVPDTDPTVDVGISTVNQCTNEEYYKDNLDNINFVYDAYTINLTARIPVEPCETYTVSLRIADGGDALWDSAVFIEDVNSNAPSLVSTTNSNLDGLMEGCIVSDVEMTRTDARTAADFKVSLGGTATNVDDYDIEIDGAVVTDFPHTFSYGVDEFTKTFKIIPKEDGTDEDIEDIKIYLEPACEGEIIDSLVFTLYDKETFTIFEGIETTDLYRCEPTQVIELPTILVDNVSWSSPDGGTFTFIDGDPTKGIIVDESTSTTSYVVEYDIGTCTGVDGFTETITVIPSYFEADDDVEICEEESVLLSASGRESYTWTATPEDPTITCLNADCSEISATPTTSTVYEVVGSAGDPEQCNTTETINVTVITGEPPAVNGLRENLKYCSDEDITVEITGDPSGGNFDLSLDGTSILTGYPLNINPSTLTTGVYSLLYTVGTGASCSEQTTRIINIVGPAEIAGLRADLKYCGSEDVVEDLTAGFNDGNFALIDPSGTSTPLGDASFNPNGLSAGEYTITYTVGDGTDCDGFAETALTIIDAPVVEGLRTSLKYCTTEDINEGLTAGDNTGNFALIDPSGTSTPLTSETFNPNGLALGDYTITYTLDDGADCYEFAEETITIVDAPVISGLRASLEYCRNEDMNEGLTAGDNTGDFALIDPSGTSTPLTSASFNPFDLDAGTYTITYTLDDGADCDEFAEQNVVIVDAPIIAGLADNYCNNVDINESLTAGDDTGNFALINPSGTSTPLSSATFNPNGLAAGTYTVTYTVGSGAACNEFDEKVITISNPPNESDLALSTTIVNGYCANDANNISLGGTYLGSAVAGNFTISKDGTVIESNATDFTPQVLADANGTGTYTINFNFMDDATTCENSRDFDFIIYDAPTATRTDSHGNTFCITDDTDYNITYTITWADGSTENVTLGSFNPTSSSSSFTFSETYPDMTNSAGCEITLSEAIVVNPLADIEILPLTKASPDFYCGVESAEPLRVRVDGVVQNADVFNIINIADGQVVINNASEFAPQDVQTALEAIYGTPLTGEFTLRIDYTFTGSCDLTADNTQAVIRFETIKYPAREVVICPNLIGDQITARPFDAPAIDTENLVFLWSKDDVENYSAQDFITINSLDDIGNYKVQVSDGDGCPKEVWEYNVSLDCETDFVLPNAFSPNGDGLNDALFPLGKNGNIAPGGDFVKLDWKIFNRWGEIVFIGDDTNMIWDGTLNGKDAPAGTYTWTATYESILEPNKTLSKKGKVTIIR